MSAVNVDPVDDRLVAALCRAAEHEHGDTDAVVRAHLRRVAPLADSAAGERLVRAAMARLDGLGRLEPSSPTPASTRCSSTRMAPSGPSEMVRSPSPVTSRPPSSRSSSNASSPRSGGASIAPRRWSTPASPTVRVCAVIPPVALDGACLSIRRFRDRALPLAAFAGSAIVAVLEELVTARCNVVVSGSTSSGKTTLLRAVLGLTERSERTVLIEDTAELVLPSANLVRLEARPPTPDGVPAVTLEHLVRTALRLRPDRLVVGEVRGPEVLALVQALNTGHDGAWSTCHANSSLDALHRLETLVLQAAPAWPMAAVRQHLSRSIDVVVHVARSARGATGRRDRRGRPRQRRPRRQPGGDW